MRQSEDSPTHGTPESAWKSMSEEEPGMEMMMTTDQLCAMARGRERENVWARRVALVACVCFAAWFAYNLITITQPWIRLGQAWMVGLMCFFFWGTIRRSPRRIRASEPCASFLQREYDGSRNTLLQVRRAILLVLPALAASWWGGYQAARAKTFHLDPSSWRFHFLNSHWLYVLYAAVLLVLLLGWLVLGKAAEKASRELETLRRGTGDHG
jgi:hypothetical protein